MKFDKNETKILLIIAQTLLQGYSYKDLPRFSISSEHFKSVIDFVDKKMDERVITYGSDFDLEYDLTTGDLKLTAPEYNGKGGLRRYITHDYLNFYEFEYIPKDNGVERKSTHNLDCLSLSKGDDNYWYETSHALINIPIPQDREVLYKLNKNLSDKLNKMYNNSKVNSVDIYFYHKDDFIGFTYNKYTDRGITIPYIIDEYN